jgi:hypothetical protein
VKLTVRTNPMDMSADSAAVTPSARIAAALFSSAAMATLALVARRLVPAKTAVAVGLLASELVQRKGNRFSGGDRLWSYRYPLETLTLAAPNELIAILMATVVDRRRIRRRGACLPQGAFGRTIDRRGHSQRTRTRTVIVSVLAMPASTKSGRVCCSWLIVRRPTD